MNEFAAIQEVLGVYFDLVYQSADVLPAEIYGDAYMAGVRDGKLVRSPIKSLVGRTETPEIKGETREDWIVRIEIISPELAYAKVKCVILPIHYTDVLCLVKDNGKWRIVAKLWAGTEDTFANWYPLVEDQEKEIKMIQITLNTYMEGVYSLNSGLSLSVFMEGARMISTDNAGKLSDVPITVLRERWHGFQPPIELGISKYARIEHIDMTGPDTAIAKIGIAKGLLFFTDLMSLARYDGAWKIVSKVTLQPIIKPAD